ncbi:hypothetical protein TIFTF001_010621 [Ficus carica]|uniref:Uncharacterized protein n=1 Tax=Ficus carica TaxID=3494 RepID=A0AA88D017_FICCA|nr:hypothetical protein TIFTF001_010621 [Ficus carica]
MIVSNLKRKNNIILAWFWKTIYLATEESVEDDTDVEEEGGGDEDDEGDDGGVGVGAAAAEGAELDLDDVDEGEHEEDAAGDGADAGDEHADTEDGLVDAAEEAAAGAGAAVGAAPDPDGLLDPDGDEAGEEERAEGVHVEGHEVLGDGGAGVAAVVGGVDEGVGGVLGVPRQPDEHGQREERVHVHDAVQCRDVHAGAAIGCHLSVVGRGIGRWSSAEDLVPVSSRSTN